MTLEFRNGLEQPYLEEYMINRGIRKERLQESESPVTNYPCAATAA